MALSVLLTDYSVTRIGSAASIHWSTSSEINAGEFELDRSLDGICFILLNHIPAHGSAHNYDLTDAYPLPGWNFYRLRLIDRDGTVTSFPVKSLNFDSRDTKPFDIISNPSGKRSINVQLNISGNQQLSLYDATGKLVAATVVNGAGSFAQLNLPAAFSPGLYIISMTGGKIVWSEKIFIR